MDFDLDSDGISEFLNSSTLADAIFDKAQEVADNARGMTDVEIVVDEYTTDRVAASVTIVDPRGAELQARDGVLTKAAAGAGLEVTAK